MPITTVVPQPLLPFPATTTTTTTTMTGACDKHKELESVVVTEETKAETSEEAPALDFVRVPQGLQY